MKFEFTKQHGIILGVFLIMIILFFPSTNNSSQEENVQCVEASDCFVFGETGTCGCGCYNSTQIEEFEKNRTEGCFCLPPEECVCPQGKCMRNV